MNLLMFAGSGSPHNNHYKGGYDLIREGATRYGHHNVEIVSWPGQRSMDGDATELTFDVAVQKATKALAQHEESGEAYTLVARSFGTIVAAKVLADRSDLHMERTVLWGPPPFPEMWKLFCRDFVQTREKFQAKGTFLGQTFFSSLEPFEANFSRLRGNVVVATGTKDIYCPPKFRDYLESLVSDQQVGARFTFREVEGAGHEVGDEASAIVQEKYIEALFR